jgi:hypothetical protein
VQRPAVLQMKFPTWSWVSTIGSIYFEWKSRSSKEILISNWSIDKTRTPHPLILECLAVNLKLSESHQYQIISQVNGNTNCTHVEIGNALVQPSRVTASQPLSHFNIIGNHTLEIMSGLAYSDNCIDWPDELILLPLVRRKHRKDFHEWIYWGLLLRTEYYATAVYTRFGSARFVKAGDLGILQKSLFKIL